MQARSMFAVTGASVCRLSLECCWHLIKQGVQQMMLALRLLFNPTLCTVALRFGFDGMQVSVMHAFIDEGDYSSMTIDEALRKMLKDFKLPGELVCPQ